MFCRFCRCSLLSTVAVLSLCHLECYFNVQVAASANREAVVSVRSDEASRLRTATESVTDGETDREVHLLCASTAVALMCRVVVN